MNFWNEQHLKEALGNAKFYNFPENWSSNGLVIWHENFQPGNMLLVRVDKEIRGLVAANVPAIVDESAAILATRAVEFYKYNKPIVEIRGNSSDAIINLARHIRKFFKGKVIGVTGSSGKSTTTQMLVDVFSSKYKTNSNIESKANTSWGIAWNMTCFDIDAGYWIIETSLGGGMSRNSAITKPDYAIITNVAPVHMTGKIQDLKDVAEEKSRIFHSMKEGQMAVLYHEMTHFDVVKKAAEYKGLKIITFGEDENSDIRIIHGEENKFIIDGKEYFLSSSHVGKHIMFDMAAALAIVKEEKFPIENAIEILKGFENLDGRGAEFDVVLPEHRMITVIDESYNANPLSMKAAITAFGEKYKERNKTLILGDMAECGDNAEKYHREIATVIDNINPNKVILCGTEIKVLYNEIQNRYDVKHFNDVNELFDYFIQAAVDGDCIMIKSSHSSNLHKIVKKLKSKP